ncbi:aminopeptidase PepB [Thalassomonas haliotis]|uniref:Aminopeptidase PepB n=1 Tax=Thalassomonas haliotis TaxID=485448 RepID=A0ABY7VBF6_9GAMM|nr:aminopeptidase PepB [Thalassomonas haliotis]WDE10984.1 aminopeptidase PepB [Thalassomonas haliotis]
MSKTTNIILTNIPVSEGWQADNTVQIFKNEIHICLKDGQELSLRDIQRAGRKIEGLGIDSAKLTGDLWTEESQWAFAMGFTCVGKLTNVEFTGSRAQQLAEKLDIFAWSRDLTNQTPSQLYPLKLAELAGEYIKAQAPEHVSIETISGEALEQQGWTGIYNVGKGSINPPCLMILDYNPTGDSQAPVAASLVGKGITFDSGGYSIKPSAGMFDMKCDMGGAAVVSGALALAISQGLDKRVKLFLCCAENMVSSHAYKLGDILTYKNGLTVEVANTDAEGRLVLADGLLAAAEADSGLIINAATLTGAAMMATGGDYTALFGLDADLMAQAKAEAVKSNEPVWQLPLERWHQDKCSSVFADTANSRTQKGGGAGGASNAAGFLARFVPNEGRGWLHMDLAAAYNGSANSLWAAGGTGQGIATIAALIGDKA